MKETFIKSTIILMIGGLLTKILGMIIRIVNTRLIGLEGISLYMLVFPTLSLFTGKEAYMDTINDRPSCDASNKCVEIIY